MDRKADNPGAEADGKISKPAPKVRTSRVGVRKPRLGVSTSALVVSASAYGVSAWTLAVSACVDGVSACALNQSAPTEKCRQSHPNHRRQHGPINLIHFLIAPRRGLLFAGHWRS